MTSSLIVLQENVVFFKGQQLNTMDNDGKKEHEIGFYQIPIKNPTFLVFIICATNNDDCPTKLQNAYHITAPPLIASNNSALCVFVCMYNA